MANNEARIKLAVDGAAAAVTDLNKITASLHGMEGQAKNFGASLLGLQGAFAGLAGVLSVGAIAAQVKGIVDAADSMNDLSQRIGITVGELGKYQLATAQSGTTMEAMAKGIKALAVNLAEHGDELRAAGITATTADGAFRQLADKFAAMPDSIEKTALATKVFGKAGMDLIPTLNLGSAGLQESAEKSARYAATLELLAPQADKFNDQMVELGLHTKVASLAIVNDAMPAMISIAQAMSLAAQESGLLMAAWVGLGGAMDEFIAKPFKVIFLGISNTIDEANARLMLFFRKTGEADKLYAAVARRNKEILALTSQTAAPAAPAAAAVKTFDTAKWTADYKALMAALGGAKDGANATNKAARDAAAELERLARAEQKHWEDLGKTLTANQGAYAKWLDQHDKTLEGLIAGNQTLREQNEAIGLSKEALDALTLSRQDAAIAQAELTLIEARNIEGNEARIIQLEREISLLKQRRDLTAAGQTATAAAEAQKTARDAAEKTARDAAAEWQKASDQIQQSLSDALMNAFTAGKGFGKTFVNSIKALFNTMVLRPVISAIVSPVAGALTGALGFSGAAQAAGTGANLLSGGSSLLSAGSTLASFGSFMGELGTGLIASTQTALGLTATAAQASYAASMGVAAQTGSLIGSLGPLISAAPYLVALAGVYKLAKNLDHSGTPHTGAGTSYSAAGGLQQASSGAIFNSGFTGIDYSASTEEFTTGIVKSVVQILDTTATTFGKTAGYQAAASFADDSSKDGAWGSLFIRNMEQVLTDWQAGGQSFRTFSDGTAGNNEFLAAVSQDVRKALDGIDLPAWAAAMLAKLGDAPGLDQLASVVSEINATQVVLQSLGASVKVFAGLSGDAVLNIINASGGLQAFGASLGAYYENFYSEQEKFDAKLGALNTRLRDLAGGGAFADSAAQFNKLITEPTRENFRKLIEAQDLTTTSGQNTYAALLGLSGVVAELTPVAEAAADAVQTLGTVATTLADVQKLFDSNAETLLNTTQYAAYRVQQIQQTLGAVGLNVSADQILGATREQVLAGYQEMMTAGNLAAASAILNVVDALTEVSAGFQGVTEESASASTAVEKVALTLADVNKLFDAGARTLLNSAEYQAYRVQQIQQTLSAAGMNFTAAQIENATREQVLAGYRQLMAAGALDAAASVLSVVDALTEVSAGFQGVTETSTSAAVAVQQVVTTLADVQGLFGNAARTLLNDVQYTAYQVAQIQATLGSVGINVTASDILGATKAQVLAGLSEMMAAGNLDAARAILSVVGALSEVSSGFQTVAATASNAAAIMQQRAGLESTLLNLTGNTAEIRARELAALDASNRGLQQHIYAIQDAQQAVQAAQQAVTDANSAYAAQESAINNLQSAAQRWIGTMATASSLLDQISGSLGGAGGNREAALWATVNGAGDIDARLSAAQELYGLITQTARTEAAAQDNALSNAKALLEYGQRLRDYVQGLKTGNLSTLTPAEKVAEALAQYQSTLAAAQGGDTTALGNLQSVADTYLGLAREFDPASYTSAVFTSVTNALDSLGAGLVSQNSPQVTLLQAQLDAAKAASSSANTLSAEQIARLQTLQTVVQDLYAQAGAQSAIANAQVSSAQANLQALSAAQLAAQQNLAAQQQAVVTAQQAATAYMATLADVAVADPVPDILRSLPEGIAAALAPLLNANPASTAAAAAATTAQRAQIIRDYAATLPQDDTGARMLYDAAVANGVSSAELDAAMGFAPGSSLAWAVSHNLPAFAQGTNYVPHDMVAQIHRGEAIIPARYNPAGQGGEALIAEIKALRAEVSRLREQNNAGHQLGAMATHENTQQITRATVEAASKARHTQHLQQRAALA